MEENKSPAGQRAEGNWKQFKGKLREKWGQLTDDELDQLKGRRDQMVGKIQERTGEERQRIEREIDDLSRNLNYRF